MTIAQMITPNQMHPATTDRMIDPILEIRRRARRRRLVVLWSLTVGVLVVQLGVAVFTTILSRKRSQPRDVVARAVVADARSTRPRDAAVPTDSARPVVDTTPPADLRTRRRPASKRRPPRRDKHASPDPPAEVTADVKVPPKVLGDPTRGARITSMGCGLCHGRTAGPLNPRSMSPRKWRRYFARGSHGRHTPLRNNFTRAELSHVKAYLMQAAKGGR